MISLPIERLTPEAKLPTYAHATDAGMDLYASETVTVLPGERVQVKTGIAMAIPSGYVGLIWDKSGLSHRHGLKVLGGVIDAGYRGEILIGLINVGMEPHTFAAGEKVAQMLIQVVVTPVLTEVASLDVTTRGAQGFGSSGA